MASDFHTHHPHPGKSELVDNGKGKAPLWSLPFHPWHTERFQLPSAADLDACTALGELGFDKFRGALPYPEEQLKLFRSLLQLASDYGKPVVLHAVGPTEHLLSCTKKFPDLKFLCHGFSKHKPQVLKELLDQGFYVSLAPSLIRDENIRAFLKSAPGCRVGLESDDAPELLIEELYDIMDIKGFEEAADTHFKEFLQL